MSQKILVVDDECAIADLIEVYLKNESYEVFKCYDALEALHVAETEPIDLAVLDIMMPGMSGFTLCQKIREKRTFPIIMLTAKDEETDKINGLTLGADDYVTKPFRPLELMARVKAQLRRYKKYNPGQGDAPAEENVIYHCGIELNIDTHECLVNGQAVTLTPTEFTILRILLERKGKVVSAEELFHGVWKDEYYSKSNNSITVHIRHLREKIGDAFDRPKYIKTIWGVGYKIET